MIVSVRMISFGFGDLPEVTLKNGVGTRFTMHLDPISPCCPLKWCTTSRRGVTEVSDGFLRDLYREDIPELNEIGRRAASTNYPYCDEPKHYSWEKPANIAV